MQIYEDNKARKSLYGLASSEGRTENLNNITLLSHNLLRVK
jgi:hypothetical protein